MKSDPKVVSEEAVAELEAMWLRFKEQSSPEARQGLIVHYSPLVKYVASRVATGLPANVEQADLVQYGIFGLMDALDKFDMSRQIKFETYAIPRIRGAIIDELRSLDWVPRSVRGKARELERAMAELEGELKRPPSEAELADRLGWTRQELHENHTQINFASLSALEEMVPSGQDRAESLSLLDTLADMASLGPRPGAGGQRDAGHALRARSTPSPSGRRSSSPCTTSRA